MGLVWKARDKTLSKHVKNTLFAVYLLTSNNNNKKNFAYQLDSKISQSEQWLFSIFKSKSANFRNLYLQKGQA